MAITEQDIADKIKELIRDSWILNGHPTTGAFEQSLESIISDINTGTNIEIWGNSYGIPVNTGVAAENIPYTPRKRGQGKGGTSKYITGLTNWVMIKLGITDPREALGIAFAIATKHSKDGMPGSGYLDKVVEEHQQLIDAMIEQFIDEQLKDIL